MESTTVRTSDDVLLHVGVTGRGPDVVVLSGGPGCVQYLESDESAPHGVRAWFPEPRGVGRSGGGPHDMVTALADLECVRAASGVERWTVVGHSWGGDLAVRYALDHPASVERVVAIAGKGIQKDRTWSATYESLRHTEPDVPIEVDQGVHAALGASYTAWIHEPDLLRRISSCAVPMLFVAAELDIRPSWPLEQLASLAPRGGFRRVSGVPHDFWSTHPQVWSRVVAEACAWEPS